MALVRWEPAREIEAFQTDMNRLFDSFFRSDTNSTVRRWAPPTDLTEEEGELVLRLDLPGMTDEDVSVEIDGNVLSISGERQDHRESSSGTAYRLERSFGRFSRSFTLPEGTDPEAIKGGLENGVLELRIPKPAEKQPRKIELAGASTGKPPTIEGKSG